MIKVPENTTWTPAQVRKVRQAVVNLLLTQLVEKDQVGLIKPDYTKRILELVMVTDVADLLQQASLGVEPKLDTK